MEPYKTKEYLAGFDAGKNGPNEKNAHFSYFRTRGSMEEWSRGNAEGIRARLRAKLKNENALA